MGQPASVRKLIPKTESFLVIALVVGAVNLVSGAVAAVLPLPSEFMRPLQLSAAVAEANLEADSDPYDATRKALIASGLGLGLVAVLLGILGSLRTQEGDPAGLLSVALSNFTLGWYCMPVWANGILRVPERLVLTEYSVDYRAPFLWLGSSYQLAILGGGAILFVAGLIFAFEALAAMIARRSWVVWLPRASLPLVLVSAWRPVLACVAWVVD